MTRLTDIIKALKQFTVSLFSSFIEARNSARKSTFTFATDFLPVNFRQLEGNQVFSKTDILSVPKSEKAESYQLSTSSETLEPVSRFGSGNNPTQNQAYFQPISAKFLQKMVESKQVKKLQYKQNLSTCIAETIENASDKPVLQALAARIKACNHNENLYLGDNGLRGSLWACNSRLCSNCVGRLSRRSRHIAGYVYQNHPQKAFAEWRFVVFTMPDDALAGLSLVRHHEIFYHAWRYLSTKSEFWKKKISGTIKTEEFTLDSDRTNTYHFHGNVLTYGYFLDEKLLKEEWTKALKLAFVRYGVEWNCPTKNGLADVFITRVSKSNLKGTISELCKYITKPQDWQSIPFEHLKDVVENARFFRAFELSGSCKETAKAIRPKPEQNPVVEPAITTNGQVNFLSELNHYTYFNTELITVPKNLPDSEIYNNSPPTLRKKHWFLRLQSGETSITEYKRELIDEISKSQKFRKLQLRQKYGYCPDFFTLDGECF